MTHDLISSAAGFFPPGTRLRVLRDRTGPRLVLAAGTPRQRWRETRWLPAYRPTARLWRLAMRLRHCLLPALSAPPTPQSAAPPRWHLQPGTDGLSPPPIQDPAHRLVVRIGTADARQKLTLLFHDARGRLCRVAKAGFLPLARAKVRDEARMLATLPAGTGPRLLWSGAVLPEATAETGEPAAQLVLFEPVQGKPIPARLPSSPTGSEWRLVDAFLARLESGQTFAAAEHPALVRLRPAHPEAPAWIAALAGRNWPVTLEHGDFAPWNLLRGPAGLQAFDWEDGRTDGFPGFDLVHFVLQTGVLMHHWGVGAIRVYATARLCDTGLTVSEAAAVVKLGALQDIVATAPGEQPELQRLRHQLLEW